MRAKYDDLREKRKGSKKRGRGGGASFPSSLSCFPLALYPPYVFSLFSSPLPQPVTQAKNGAFMFRA